jgi:hypothetical protein
MPSKPAATWVCRTQTLEKILDVDWFQARMQLLGIQKAKSPTFGVGLFA